MILLYPFFISSALQETNINSCQDKNVFKIKKFEMTSPNIPRAGTLSFSFYAELTYQIENPFLEIQVLSEDNRIPVFRIRDTLCRDNVLRCPASFSPVLYKNQIHLPATLNPGSYILRFTFREGKQTISCYEKSFQIADIIN